MTIRGVPAIKRCNNCTKMVIYHTVMAHNNPWLQRTKTLHLPTPYIYLKIQEQVRSHFISARIFHKLRKSSAVHLVSAFSCCLSQVRSLCCMHSFFDNARLFQFTDTITESSGCLGPIWYLKVHKQLRIESANTLTTWLLTFFPKR